MKNTILFLVLFLVFCGVVQAQVSGSVFRDFNGNGTKDANEPFVGGVTVNIYNTTGALCGTATTAGNAAPNYTVPATCSGAVRVEFVMPAAGSSCSQSGVDNSSLSGKTYGSSTQFVTAPATLVNYALYYPGDYNTGANTAKYFVPTYSNGDPLAGGTSGTTNPWFMGTPYNSNGNPTITTNGTIVGACWGVAASRPAQKVFTSAFVKRGVGLGTSGVGGIYMLTPSGASFSSITPIFNMNNNSFSNITRVSADGVAGAPTYGAGSSYNLVGSPATQVTYLGANDPLTGLPFGLGVVGSNIQRILDKDIAPASGAISADPAAFDQVGKVGMGNLEISDDGLYLFVYNLYQNNVWRLTLNNAANPTSVVAVQSFSLPATSVTNGVLRGFGLKYYRGSLYIGATATGENGGTTANMFSNVYQMLNATSASPSISTTPIITVPLNYVKGFSNITMANSNKWYTWTNTTLVPSGSTQGATAIPVLSDMDFTENGDMVLGWLDRTANQYFYNSSPNFSTTTGYSSNGRSGGEIMIAGKNSCNGNIFTIESGGKYTSVNGSIYTGSTNNNQGIGGGEFFYNDADNNYNGVPFNSDESETSEGGLAILKGTNVVVNTAMDPVLYVSQGTNYFSTKDGTLASSYYSQGYASLFLGGNNSSYGQQSKMGGIGDVELLTPEAPIEIGNRIWNDTNKNGIQDAGEAGIGAVAVNLYDATGTVLIGTVNTDVNGNYYFSNATGTNAAGIAYLNGATTGTTGLIPNTNYVLKIGAGSWTAGAGLGGLLGLSPSPINAPVAAGVQDEIDSDASLVSSIPTISLTTGTSGSVNHSFDFGFSLPQGSVGNYVWSDTNHNGINDEAPSAGINGITVQLWNASTNTLLATTTTANDASGNPGYYNFVIATTGSYYVHFPTSNGASTVLTTATSTAATDNNSDADTSTGNSPSFTITVNGTGIAKDNMTIDAGYYTCPTGCVPLTVIKK